MNREKKIIQTSIIGIIVNVLLVAAKAFIGILAGSIAIISDAINNLTDASSSIITIIGTKLSNKKPDAKHPYGHGRIEYVTGLIIAALILFAGGSAIYESIRSLIDKNIATYTYVSIIVVSISIVVKIGLGLYFRLVGKKVNSEALKGSGIDALFDAILSASTLVGIIVAMTAKVSIEGYLGIAIGLFIIRSGFLSLRTSLSSIIGERSSKEKTQNIKKAVLSHEGVLGAYDLILNDYGPERSIGSIHIEVDEHMTAREIHKLTREISKQIYIEFGIIMTVGIYARNMGDSPIADARSKLNCILSNYANIKQIHGFYMNEEDKEMSFDLVIDFKEEKKEELVNKIKEEIQTLYPDYKINVTIDLDFSD